MDGDGVAGVPYSHTPPFLLSLSLALLVFFIPCLQNPAVSNTKTFTRFSVFE